MSMTNDRSRHFEIWSRCEDGTARLHGRAEGITFEDACKHLACESLDFWSHYTRGKYRGVKLYSSKKEAIASAGTGADRGSPTGCP